MINAEEHKKILKQIAELEKNSVNYFDVEKEFFLIESDNLSRVHSKLYGYSIQRTGIYEDDDLTAEAIAGLDGRGCYVYVEVKDSQLTIKQDLNGCWGLYLFRHGNYFALSNSFFRLLDHVKFKYPLTVNRDYFQHMFLTGVSPILETAVNEIERIDRNAIIHIDTTNKTLEFEMIDYKDFTVPLDSPEGIAILDRWIEFWGNVYRGVLQNTNRIAIDLSGGFDSRISFVTALQSGMDLNKVRIHSRETDRFTFSEDRDIASVIVKHYGLKLNKPLPDSRFMNHSFSDIFNIDSYVYQTFGKIFNFRHIKFVDKLYHFGGIGGETIRYYWENSPREFVNSLKWTAQPYSTDLSHELFASIEKIFESIFRTVSDKHGIGDPNSPEINKFLYRETNCPTHFGKGNMLSSGFLHNEIYIAPIIDPELRTLKLCTPECTDLNLLMALIFVRYEPDLLAFRFDSKQSIKFETIEYAKKINERFPRRITTDKIDGGGVFYLQPHDKRVEKILDSNRDNPKIPNGFIIKCVKAAFESSRSLGLFTAYFDEELYRNMPSYYNNDNYRDRQLYGLWSITKVLADVETSQRNGFLYQDIHRYLEQDFYKIQPQYKMPDKFEPYITARIDFQLKPNESTPNGDIEILSISDKKIKMFRPEWLSKSYVMSSQVGQLEFVFKSTVDGEVNFWFRGMWVTKPENKLKPIPYWVDYTKLTINDNLIFDTLTPAWHNKPYLYKIDAKAGEEIKVEVEWQPHRSDT